MAVRRDASKLWLGETYSTRSEEDILTAKLKRQSAKNQAPTSLSPFKDAHLAYGFRRDVGTLAMNVLNSDDEWTRQRMATFEPELIDYMNVAGLPAALQRARTELANGELTDEAKNQRAVKLISDVFEKVRRNNASMMTRLMTKLEAQESLIAKALAPERVREGMEGVFEQRCCEVRTFLSGLDAGHQVGAVIGFGKGAALLALSAIQDDPCARVFCDKPTLDAAKCTALRAMGVEFLLDDLEDVRDDLMSLATRMTILELTIWSGIKSLGANPEEPKLPWQMMAANAVNRSKEILDIAGTV